MNKEQSDELLKLIERVKPCTVISDKAGLEVFRKWEEEHKDECGVFKKVEIQKDMFPCSNNIYFIPTAIENKPLRIYFDGE